MILPNKHTKADESVLGLGAKLLHKLSYPQTVSSLWEKVRQDQAIATFERFTLALIFLYTVGTVEFKEGILRRIAR